LQISGAIVPNTDNSVADSDAGIRLPVPVTTIGGLPIAVIDRAQSARLMLDIALARGGANRPVPIFTSANGQVVSMCADDADIRKLFLAADLIHADGMPLVFASQLLGATALPERVATTDLFHDVARLAQACGATFYLLGATSAVMEATVRRVLSLYPRLEIVGCRDGYFSREQEPQVVEAVDAVRPDILWLGMGAPAEQRFALRNRDRLRNVGLIKTSGGLFDFLSGRNRRAPHWMQAVGLEWAYRVSLEPKRLGTRYAMTNPHALFLLLTRTRRPGSPAYPGAQSDFD
jgi:N-acetylglucosaminyldiphosphoundecaprenol N-acetyl-beta-D-mannosaminyltransferase